MREISRDIPSADKQYAIESAFLDILASDIRRHSEALLRTILGPRYLSEGALPIAGCDSFHGKRSFPYSTILPRRRTASVDVRKFESSPR